MFNPNGVFLCLLACWQTQAIAKDLAANRTSGIQGYFIRPAEFLTWKLWEFFWLRPLWALGIVSEQQFRGFLAGSQEPPKAAPPPRPAKSIKTTKTSRSTSASQLGFQRGFQRGFRQGFRRGLYARRRSHRRGGDVLQAAGSQEQRRVLLEPPSSDHDRSATWISGTIMVPVVNGTIIEGEPSRLEPDLGLPWPLEEGLPWPLEQGPFGPADSTCCESEKILSASLLTPLQPAEPAESENASSAVPDSAFSMSSTPLPLLTLPDEPSCCESIQISSSSSSSIASSTQAPLPPLSTDAAACNDNDQMAIHALGGGNHDGSWPKTNTDCVRFALSWVWGVNQEKFNTCLTQHVPIRMRCSTCFGQAADYGFKHCKGPCWRIWYSESCLKCAAGFDIQGCAGFDPPHPTCEVDEGMTEKNSDDDTTIPIVTLIGFFASSGIVVVVLSLRFCASTTGTEPLLGK